MKIFDFMKPKCVICGERDGNNMSIVKWFGGCGEMKIHFHRSCLSAITCDPEHYKHTQVDQAINIIDRLAYEKKRILRSKEKNKENCKKLANYCVDNNELF